MPTTGRSRVSSSSEHSELPHELRALSHRKLRNRHWYRCTLCVCEGKGGRGGGKMWDMRICMFQCTCNMYICIMCVYTWCECVHVQCACVCVDMCRVCVCVDTCSVCVDMCRVCAVCMCVLWDKVTGFTNIPATKTSSVHLRGQSHSSILCVCVV